MKKPLLSLLLLASACVAPALAQTTVTPSNTVTSASPLSFGLNRSEGTAARDLNALNNYTSDPGFGRQLIRIKGTCDGGGTTYAEHAQGTPPISTKRCTRAYSTGTRFACTAKRPPALRWFAPA